MWTGSGRTTNTERSLTLYVTNISEHTTAADVSELFSKDEGFCGLRAVGGSRKMAFVDFGSEMQATQAMRRHQGHRFEGCSEGLMIDFDHDKRTKRSRAIEKPWDAASFDSAPARSAHPAGWGPSAKRGRGTDRGRGRRRLPSREREAAMFRREQADRRTAPCDLSLKGPPPKMVKRPPCYLTVRKLDDGSSCDTAANCTDTVQGADHPTLVDSLPLYSTCFACWVSLKLLLQGSLVTMLRASSS